MIGARTLRIESLMFLITPLAHWVSKIAVCKKFVLTCTVQPSRLLPPFCSSQFLQEEDTLGNDESGSASAPHRCLGCVDGGGRQEDCGGRWRLRPCLQGRHAALYG